MCHLHRNSPRVQAERGPRSGWWKVCCPSAQLEHFWLGWLTRGTRMKKGGGHLELKVSLSSLTPLLTAENSSQSISTGIINPPIPHPTSAPWCPLQLLPSQGEHRVSFTELTPGKHAMRFYSHLPHFPISFTGVALTSRGS